MIHRYTHKNIDRISYTKCLSKSLNYRIYAELWFLDIVSPHGYDILVLNDFEAIMPIPVQTKLGFTFVAQPVFCQQLGVFYKNEISNKNFHLFFSRLKKYRVRSYCFNEENTPYFPSTATMKNNQVLYLDSEYSFILNKYSKDKKKIIENNLLQKISVIERFDISFIDKEIYPKLISFLKKSQISILKSLLYNLNKRKQLKQYIVYNLENDPSVFFWLILSKKRIIKFFSVRIKDAEVKNSYAHLLNTIIKQFSNQKIIFDFEGSMIPGVFSFNKSFGAISRKYIKYQNFTWFERVKKWFGK